MEKPTADKIRKALFGDRDGVEIRDGKKYGYFTASAEVGGRLSRNALDSMEKIIERELGAAFKISAEVKARVISTPSFGMLLRELADISGALGLGDASEIKSAYKDARSEFTLKIDIVFNLYR